MPLLVATTRRELLDLLNRLPILDTPAGRDMLLRDLPADLVSHMKRDAAKAIDLDAIVYSADAWWPGDGQVAYYPLRRLVENASDLVKGSEDGQRLAVILAQLPIMLDPSDHPRCPYPGMVPFSPEDARFF